MLMRILMTFGLFAVTGAGAEDRAAAVTARAPAGDGAIEYILSGPEDGEPLLLLHGSFLAEAFAPVAVQPALNDYRLIRVHRRGYAGSSGFSGDSFSIADQAADAFAVMDALGIERAHVGGYSYGGAVMLEMAAASPERLASLVLIESAPPPGVAPQAPPPVAEGGADSPPPDPLMATGMKAGEQLAEGDAEGALETMSSFIFGDDWRDFYDAVPGGYEQALADMPNYFPIEGAAIGAWMGAAYDAGALDQPVLVMWGGEGGPAASLAEATIAAFPDAEGVEAPGVDHALPTAAPEAAAQAIADFLARHPM